MPGLCLSNSISDFDMVVFHWLLSGTFDSWTVTDHFGNIITRPPKGFCALYLGFFEENFQLVTVLIEVIDIINKYVSTAPLQRRRLPQHLSIKINQISWTNERKYLV